MTFWNPAKSNFSVLILFFILISKILPIWFGWVSRCHLKDFNSRIPKQGLLLAYLIFQFSKFGPKLLTYRWDTLYMLMVSWIPNSILIVQLVECWKSLMKHLNWIIIIFGTREHISRQKRCQIVWLWHVVLL